MGIEQVLLSLADRILDFDEASLTQLQEKYLNKISEFAPSREWERAVIVYFLINSVRVKNKIFNDEIKGSGFSEAVHSPRKSLKIVK